MNKVVPMIQSRPRGAIIGATKRPKDLGTYWIRVEGHHGRKGDDAEREPFGFLFRVETACAYEGGATAGIAPIDAERTHPPFEDEHELVETMKALFTVGPYSCDCNLEMFVAAAAGQIVHREHSDICRTNEYHYDVEKLTLVKPNRSERVIWVAT